MTRIASGLPVGGDLEYADEETLAKALEKATAYDGPTLLSAFKGLEIESPQGKIKVDPTNNHTWLQSRIGKVKPDGTFEIVYSSKEWVKPEL